MTVFRAIHKPNWSWPTRLAPLLHEIMFCLELSYVKGGAIFGHNKHILSVKTKYQVPLFQIINPSRLLPLTFQFTTSLWSCTVYYISLLFTVLDIIYSSSNIAKIDSLYFLNWLMCKLLLHFLPRLKMWMGEDLAWQYASCVYSKQNKAHWCLSSEH